MEIYSLNYDYIKDFTYNVTSYFSFEQSALYFSILIVLVSILVLSRKMLKLEKTQLNDIDDITGFNRLIDEELGMLKKEQNNINQEIDSSKTKITSNSESSSEGKLFNNAPYTQAVQLASRGYARKDIISLCSLTESEAELILALHSNDKAA
ncbi:MAG: DUF2802 domain-containing protein [Gammaproteobacteria bacterium]|nr:MAG: DUF2802 domain-containing protein [Gammaproteobacteria bacterium]